MKTKNLLVMPNYLMNPVYVNGLCQPLEAVAEILDEQGKHNFAKSLREASQICQVFSQVNIEKTHKLFTNENKCECKGAFHSDDCPLRVK